MIFLRACCKNAADLRLVVARATCPRAVAISAAHLISPCCARETSAMLQTRFYIAHRISQRRRNPALFPTTSQWTALLSAALRLANLSLAIPRSSRIYRRVDALARAYGPWWLCNDVTRPFWQSGGFSCRRAGPEREVDMVAVSIRAVAPCPDAALRGTRQRGRGGRAIDPSSLS